MNEHFRKFAQGSGTVLGSAWAFLIAIGTIVVWAITGPSFHYSETWQLAINTGTSVVTFLMVFLLQNTQNRDSTALHLKLDELLRAIGEARTGLVGLQTMTDAQLEALRVEFDELAEGERSPDTPGASGAPDAQQ